ncbi:MAG: hypothetical protein ACO3M2_13120, partial [Pseudohongiellaceae bacterium]
NSGWITLYQLDGEWSTIALEDGTAAAPSLYFKDSGTDTGVYSPGADQVGIATGGVQRVNFNGSTEVVFNDGGADVDFRIEGDTDANLFKVDAGADEVSISSIAYPKTDGTADQSLVTDGSGSLSFATRARFQAGTAVASTSGTSIDFTGIPSWVKRITVMFFDVSTNGSDYLLVQLGTSGGMATDANYFSMTGANTTSNTASAVNYTTGFGIQSGSAANSLQGRYTFVNITGNTWVADGLFTGNTAAAIFAAGRRTLSGALTQLRITSTGGTNTFDAGNINILYEG